MDTLVALSYSPWSEKARWALDHHRIPYREEAHMPMLGEVLLRLRTRRVTGRITVPVLIGSSGTVSDSLAIAQRAEQTGHGPRLFPAELMGEILNWNGASEIALEAGRALVTDNFSHDEEALAEALPAAVPESLRKSLIPMARSGTRFIARKYNLGARPLEAHRDRYREQLLALRGRLAASSPYLLGRFTYADIAMAVSLQFMNPPADRYLPFQPGTRRCLYDERLTGEFGDLIRWRDSLYEKHRGK